MAITFSREFHISSYDLNPKGQARLTTMANFFQEVAYHHASDLGLGYDDMKRRKTTWVLSRMRICMERYPVWNEQIKLETWPSGAERLFALRDFRVTDSQGELIGKASTAWLILDLDTHRLVRPREMLEQFKLIIHDERMFEEALDKIAVPGELSFLKQHAVVFSDLDIVGHVNNVKYMEWCMDALSTAENAEQEIRELEINFNHEALFGDLIRLEGTVTERGELVFLATREEDGQEIITARIKRE
ncbi:MAG: thioesterase [Bacteroidales bacterium]|nr:thioesterase [Bacteroidales bacterium]